MKKRRSNVVVPSLVNFDNVDAIVNVDDQFDDEFELDKNQLQGLPDIVTSGIFYISHSRVESNDSFLFVLPLLFVRLCYDIGLR